MTSTVSSTIYNFEGYRLDVTALELRDPAGEVIELSPTALELLSYLVKNQARVVTKNELFDHLWPDVVVNENALAQTVWAARKAVGDAGRAQRVIKNVRGRGYRFVAGAIEEKSNRGSTPRPRTDPPVANDVVGREQQLLMFEDDLASALGGQGRVRVLSGEAGIGKTRLMEELAARAASHGFRVLEGRCHEDEGMPPYWPWKQALGAFEKGADTEVLRECVGPDGADLAKLLPGLRHRLALVAEALEREVDDDRFYLFQAVTEFLARAAERQPLVISIDDVHWADLPSLQLLKFVAPYISRTQLVILVTYRGNELDADRDKVLRGVTRHACTFVTELGGLNRDAIAELLRRTGRSASDRVVARVTELTAGNPFFAMQFARLAGETSAIAEKDVDGLELPGALEQVLSRRLDGLPEEGSRALRFAAILGQEFSLGDLRRTSNVPSEALLVALEMLTTHRIVQCDESHPGTYRFTHPLLREAAYRGIAEPARAKMHRDVAQAIETAYAGYPLTRLEELAHHYYAAAPAGTAEKAVHYAQLAARRAFEGTAFEEAVRHYRRALSAVDSQDAPDEGKRSELLLGLGHALRGAREPVEQIRAAFSQVAERADSMGDADLFADAALAYAGHGPLRLGQLTEMGAVDATEVALLERALDKLGPKDSSKKALVLAWLGRALYHSSDTERRARAARNAVDMARRLSDPRVVAVTLLLKQQILRTPHSLPERVRDLTETIAITERIGARELQLDARHERAWAHVELAEIAEAERDVRIVARIADELQQPSERRVVELWNLVNAYVRENIDVVESRDRERYMQRRNARTGQAYSVRLMMARYIQGRAAETLSLMEGYAERFPLPVSWQCGLASTYATVGRMADARRVFEELAVTDFSTVPMTHDWMPSYMLLANACQLLGDRKRARLLIDILQPFEGNILVYGIGTFIGGIVARTLGDLHRLLGDVAEAERCYDLSLDIAERLRSPGNAAWTHVDRAELFLNRGAPNDRARAAALLDQADPIIDEMGVGLLRQRVGGLRDRLHCSRAPGPSMTHH